MDTNSILDLPEDNGVFTPNYTGFWPRVGAYFIDAILLGIVQQIISYGVAGHSTFNNTGFSTFSGTNLLVLSINMLIGIGYFVYMESSVYQATLGKMAIGAIVVDEQGNRISPANALGRYFAKILSGLILLVGFIMVAFDSKKQGLHDKLAHTLVVYK